MDAELKRKWVEALRSGKYEQGTGKLKNDINQFCCLGVLCAVAGLGITPDGNNVVGNDDPDCYHPLYALTETQTLGELWRLNDGINRRQHSFSEIADYIEENL